MRILLIGLAATLVAGCETAGDIPARSDRAQATYERALAGKTAGRAEKCLPLHRTRDMEKIDDTTILFRDGNTTYVNTTLGACNGMGDQSYALVTRNVGPQLCRGDIATVTDMTSGMTVGSCALGDFVPYRSAP
ncbi:MAG TPA: hypothetical protein VFO42_00890 [Sphingomicrobium sp.]|nr:hypothetical protein [Sphingomicrobium sp.]